VVPISGSLHSKELLVIYRCCMQHQVD